MKKRVLSLVLAVILIVGLLPTAAFASTNGKTADDAINWVRSLNGQPVGSGECVALIYAYYSYLGQTSPGGNGVDYWYNDLPAGWTRIPNAQPKKATFWSMAAAATTSMAMLQSMNRIIAPGTRTMPISAKSSMSRTSSIMDSRIRISASSARISPALCTSRILSTSARISTVISSVRTNGCPPERAMTKTQNRM